MARSGLDPAKREAILTSVREGAGQRSAGSIAREHGVAVSTVTRLAKQHGLDGQWQRTTLARATEAKTVDNRARRAQLADDHLSDAIRLRRERLWSPTPIVTPSGQMIELELPPAQDVRHYMAAIGAAIKTSMEVERHDASDSSAGAAVDAWLRAMLGGDGGD